MANKIKRKNALIGIATAPFLIPKFINTSESPLSLEESLKKLPITGDYDKKEIVEVAMIKVRPRDRRYPFYTAHEEEALIVGYVSGVYHFKGSGKNKGYEATCLLMSPEVEYQEGKLMRKDGVHEWMKYGPAISVDQIIQYTPLLSLEDLEKIAKK